MTVALDLVGKCIYSQFPYIDFYQRTYLIKKRGRSERYTESRLWVTKDAGSNKD